MKATAIKTRLMLPPKDDLLSVILTSVKKIKEKSVLAIASKVVSLDQGRCIPKAKVLHKDDLIKKEANRYLPRELSPKGMALLTIKNNILIPTSGIDESNAGEYYILWPKKPNETAKNIYKILRKKYRLKDFGVIIVDSHTVPLRRGVVGVAVGYYGFYPINDYRGTKDLFGRKFKISTSNIVDSLATSAVMIMGEGKEQTPLVLIEDLPFVKFSERDYKPKKKYSSLAIKAKEDIYGPLLNSVKWEK
jgi:putative folate metabolism gamma-glutamate ligase